MFVLKKSDQIARWKRSKKDESEEEEDYMSNDFINQIVDTRPGLVFSHSQARKNQMEKNHQKKSKESNIRNLQMSSANLEKQKREEALSTSLLTESGNNKGLNLMKKMGYKPGESLGSNNKAGNLIEPIAVEIKVDRGGLGRAEDLKRKFVEIEELKKRLSRKRAQADQMTAEAYVENKRSKFILRKLIHDLHKFQKICYQLDSTDRNLKAPEMKWLWPAHIMAILNEPKEKTDIKECSETVKKIEEVKEKVEIVEMIRDSSKDYYEKIVDAAIEQEASSKVVDLKSVYEERLKNFVNTAHDTEGHDLKEAIREVNEEAVDDDENVYSSKYLDMVRKEQDKSDGSANEAENEEDINEEVVRKKIDIIYQYLKEVYFYCVWCGTRYESEEDFNQNCPGPNEEDHE